MSVNLFNLGLKHHHVLLVLLKMPNGVVRMFQIDKCIIGSFNNNQTQMSETKAQKCKKNPDLDCCKEKNNVLQLFFPQKVMHPVVRVSFRTATHFSEYYTKVYIWISSICAILILIFAFLKFKQKPEPRPVLLRHRRSGHIKKSISPIRTTATTPRPETPLLNIPLL
jgi:hypothetical protein